MRKSASKKAERINPFPTTIDFGTGKTDTYVNKVAPTARIYLHLICRKRHLPLKLRKGKTMGCTAKLNTALALRETSRFFSLSRHRATRDKCIGRCVNSPLKKGLCRWWSESPRIFRKYSPLSYKSREKYYFTWAFLLFFSAKLPVFYLSYGILFIYSYFFLSNHALCICLFRGS